MKFIWIFIFRKFFNGCGSAYPGKNGDAGKMEGKTYCRHSRAGKHVVLYRIVASLSGEFYSDLFWIVSVLLLVRGGLGKRTAKEVLYGTLLLGISSFCFGGALYVAETFRYIPGIFVKMAVFLVLWMLLYLYTETDQNRQRICEVSLWQCGKNRKVKALLRYGKPPSRTL